MGSEATWTPTRREFFAASCGLLICRAGWAAPKAQPALAWAMDRRSLSSSTASTISRPKVIDSVGRLEWVGSTTETQLPRLDGYSVWFEQQLNPPIPMHGQFTLSAWIALESYPVNTAALLEWGTSPGGVRLVIDRLGYATVSTGSEGLAAKSKLRIDRYRWVHLSATLSPEGTLALFVDGAKSASMTASSGSPQVPSIERLYVGRAKDSDVVADMFPTGVLNGLLRDVRVYDVPLDAADIRSLSQEFEKQAAPLELNRIWFSDDPQRPKYHTMPPRAWTNEPHGLVHWRGEYHLFYQKNSNGPYWGHIHWGHMTSSDLLHWTEQQVALTPEDGLDAEGCWSGSVIVVDDKLHIFYTGGDGKRATICMATSEGDGVFRKHPGNPVIEAPPEELGVKEFRDPFIWKEGAEYRMIVGSGVEGVGGTALLYRSRDLISWNFLKPLLIGRKESSGIFWEMPVFVRIGLYHVLIVCEVPGRASYWVGRWKDDDFQVLSPEPQRLDLLNHFLSPTPCTTEDGRVIVMGILPDSRDPSEAWQAGWAHIYGIPRELSLDREGRLEQRPFRELRTKLTTLTEASLVEFGTAWKTADASGTVGNLHIEFSQGDSDAVVVAIRRSPDEREQTLLKYEWRSQTLVLDRLTSSINSRVLRNIERASYVPQERNRITFDIYLDQSAIEVFVDDRACFGARIYPVLPESVGIAFRSEGRKGAVATMRMQSL